MTDSSGVLLRLHGAELRARSDAPAGAAPALQWILQPGGAGPAALSAAQRDLARLATLPASHPLAVARFEERPDGALWVTLPPRREGPDRGLDALLRERPRLPLPWVRVLAESLCAQVSALHQQGIVHGGICPALIRVCEGSSPFASPARLLGAGWSGLWLAWAQESDCPAALLRYRAPEQLRTGARLPDRQADLYAVGCVVFEALTGEPLFVERDAAALREAILPGPRPALRARLEALVEPLSPVLLRCLAAEPEARHPSATALWRELAPALGAPASPLPTLHDSGAPGPEPAQPPAPAPARPARVASASRRPRMLPSGLVLAALLAALGALLLLQAWRSRAPAVGTPGPEASDPAAAAERLDAQPAQPAPAPDPPPDAAPARTVPSPRPVAPDPRTQRLHALLARVGLSEAEVVVSPLLQRLFSRAAAALRRQDPRAFDQALQPLELATAPRQCERIRRQKVAYILGGIRALGNRLGRWERFRLERALADAAALDGPCPKRSALLGPLVLEIRDRLAYKHARGQ